MSNDRSVDHRRGHGAAKDISKTGDVANTRREMKRANAPVQKQQGRLKAEKALWPSDPYGSRYGDAAKARACHQ